MSGGGQAGDRWSNNSASGQAAAQVRNQAVMNTPLVQQMQAQQALQNPGTQAPQAPMPQMQSPFVGWTQPQQNDLAPMQMYQQARQSGLSSLPASQPWQQSYAPFQQPHRSFFGGTSIAQPGQQAPVGLGAK